MSAQYCQGPGCPRAVIYVPWIAAQTYLPLTGANLSPVPRLSHLACFLYMRAILLFYHRPQSKCSMYGWLNPTPIGYVRSRRFCTTCMMTNKSTPKKEGWSRETSYAHGVSCHSTQRKVEMWHVDAEPPFRWFFARLGRYSSVEILLIQGRNESNSYSTCADRTARISRLHFLPA